MPAHKNLLLEIGCEELPPKSLKKIGLSLKNNLIAQLEKQQLIQPGCPSRWYASPRRVAVYIEAVATKQADQTIKRRGPALSAAFDGQGQPSQAAKGFARSVGVEFNELERLKTDKGEWLYYPLKKIGLNADVLIPQAVAAALKNLHITKPMRWSNLDTYFIRPVHWLVLLHGKKVIETELLSTKSGNYSYGHRFHHNQPLYLSNTNEYEQLLKDQGMVIADYEQRKQQIQLDIKQLAKQHNAKVLLDEALLNEVTGLVELPVALYGQIDEEFMHLPPEVLISSMQDHQRYFPLVDEKNRLLPGFITISNIRSKNPQRIINGNQRVLRSRLADANFFWQTDQHKTMAHNAARLNDVLFHKKLGTMGEKSIRLVKLASHLAKLLGADINAAQVAASLCKADLVSDMVAEFPQLQGIIGRYYALADGKDSQVANAIEQHYQPRFSGDKIPADQIGQIVALADKLDTLCGIFAAAEIPSGDRDPYALRRTALGVMRILIEAKLELDLTSIVNYAMKEYRCNPQLAPLNCSLETEQTIIDFMFERLKTHYQTLGYDTRLYQSVLAIKPTSPLDFNERIQAVAHFASLEQAHSLSMTNKRIANILKRNPNSPTIIDIQTLDETAELDLYQRIQEVKQQIKPLLEKKKYTAILNILAELTQVIDTFFDQVMVMDENIRKRSNRIALLKEIADMFIQVADIAYLQQ